jgi:hypothetical protein
MPSKVTILEKELRKQRAEQAALAEQIRESEKRAEQLERDKVEIHNMLPPFEELELRQKEADFEVQVMNQTVGNKRRGSNQNITLNLLLFLTVCACLWWAYQKFHHLWFAQ